VIKELNGEAGNPITIRAADAAVASIDGSLPDRFRIAGNTDWVKASEFDTDAHPDEYVSRVTFPDLAKMTVSTVGRSSIDAAICA